MDRLAQQALLGRLVPRARSVPLVPLVPLDRPVQMVQLDRPVQPVSREQPAPLDRLVLQGRQEPQVELVPQV